jgi:hypothetical protein
MPAGFLSSGGTAREIDGHRRADVKGTLVHLPLDDVSDASERVKLQSIPTGPTIPADDADALVRWGERLAQENATMRGMVAGSGAWRAAGKEGSFTLSLPRRFAPRKKRCRPGYQFLPLAGGGGLSWSVHHGRVDFIQRGRPSAGAELAMTSDRERCCLV